MSKALVQKVAAQQIAFIGDVHGELSALNVLLERLEREGDYFLIFLGDLIDRGPDSLGVVRRVRALVDSGRAQCLLGNHELNLLRGDKKPGSYWFFGEHEEMPGANGTPYDSSLLNSEDERAECLEFWRDLPVALEGDSWRAVHACWDEPAVTQARELSRSAFIASNFGKIADEPELPPRYFSIEAGAPEYDLALAEEMVARQMSSPIDILCSGRERVIAARRAFFAGGKWRQVEREPWWEHYEGVPAIVGHYWRLRKPTAAQRARAIPSAQPGAWWGSGLVYCVDYSVGRRHRERFEKWPRRSALGCLLWPESQLLFDDGSRALVEKPILRAFRKH